MKFKLMPTSKKIETRQTYSFEEVLDTLKKEANLPAEPYVHSVLGLKGIYVPGTSTHDVSITVGKNKITVAEASKPTLKNFAVDMLTEGWSTIVGSNASNIDEIVNAVAAEVQRLFGK